MGNIINRYPLVGLRQYDVSGLSAMSSIHDLVHEYVVFDIAATPQGGSELFPARQGYEGNRIIRFAHLLIPSLCFRNPQGGSCNTLK